MNCQDAGWVAAAFGALIGAIASYTNRQAAKAVRDAEARAEAHRQAAARTAAQAEASKRDAEARVAARVDEELKAIDARPTVEVPTAADEQRLIRDERARQAYLDGKKP